MNADVESLRHALCRDLCRDVDVRVLGDHVAVSLPLVSRDGDHLTAYLSAVDTGWRVSDAGTTLMRLSYDHDLNQLLSGAREALFESVLAESGLSEEEGEIYVEVPATELSSGLFALGQGLTKVESIGLWTRTRIESTFYDDLHRVVTGFVPQEDVSPNYTVPDLPGGDAYPVDFMIRAPRRPLFLFGVHGIPKARLTTIVLQYLHQHGVDFESMVVCSDVDELPKQDRARLMNAANDMVASIRDVETIGQKIRHRRMA